MILQWAYLGMGIKGAGIIIPIAAVFLPGRPAVWSLLSRNLRPCEVFIGAAFFKGMDPLLPGLALSGMIALAEVFLQEENNPARMRSGMIRSPADSGRRGILL